MGGRPGIFFPNSIYGRARLLRSNNPTQSRRVQRNWITPRTDAQIVAKALPCDFWNINLAKIGGLCPKLQNY